MAPGLEILSTEPNCRYGYKSGTSMACPFVSGLAALRMTMRRHLTAEHDKRIIENNVKPRSQYRYAATSGGLIDVFKPVQGMSETSIDYDNCCFWD